MFKSAHVPCYLNSFAGHGEDTDNKELKLVFHIAPIEQQLAAEIDPRLADRLFRREEDKWEPAGEMPKASFAKIAIPMQNITFNSLPEDYKAKDGVLVEGAAISNLRAQRVNPELPDFRLEFDVVVPMDSDTMRLVERFYKSTCFLTMEEIQMGMEFDGKVDAATEGQIGLQDAADGNDAGEGKKKGKGRGKKDSTASLDGKSAGAGE